MNEKIDIKPKFLSPFKRFCMTIGELPTSYVETMTYYEMILWFTKYLGDTVIPAINNNAEALKEVQSLFIELQDYVNTYFENLDIQEEINNKLDDMAESGELADIIAQYLQLAGLLTYDTINDLKSAENLVNGSNCKTLGFYSINDGGGALYKVRTKTELDVIDNMFIFPITNDNTIVAELVKEDNILNVLKLGVKNDGSEDISTKVNALTEDYSLKFPAGVYLVSNIINVKNSIYGEGYARDELDTNKRTTFITSVIDKTFNVVGNTDRNSISLENITISVDSETTDESVIYYDSTNNTRLYINKLSVFNYSGKAIYINPTTDSFFSRCVYINTATLFAKPYSANSFGIYLTDKVGDNMIENVEIMYSRYGIYNYDSLILDNVHIWCGGTGSDQSNWWSTTRGIVNNSGKIQANNLYIDTASIGVSTINKGLTFINNFFYWEDNSIAGSEFYNGNIFYTDNFKTNLNVVVNNAMIYIGSRVKYINGKIKNLKLKYSSLSNLNFNSLHGVDDLTYYLQIENDSAVQRYLPIAVIQVTGKGFSEIEVATDSGQNADIYISYDWTNNLTLIQKYWNKQNGYYYQVIDDKLIIYVETSSTSFPVNVVIKGKSVGMFPINLNSLIDNNGDWYTFPALTSTTGLTQITSSVIE